jgi:electron transfer flavoprotein alpha subunit
MTGGVLVLAEFGGAGIDAVTRELVAGAVRLRAGKVSLAVIGGPRPDPRILAIAGVDAAIYLPVAEGETSPEALRSAINSAVAATGVEAVVAAFTWRNSSVAPAVAVDLGWSLATDIIQVSRSDDGCIIVVRPTHAGKLLAELEITAKRGAVILVRPGSIAPAMDGSAPALDTLPIVDSPGLVRHVRFIDPIGNGVDLTKASVIFAVGRGVGEDNLPRYAAMAQKLGAALGSSRPVVDLGWLPHDHQVGQSGVAVQPDLYVAFGISGALQHTVGIRGAKVIVAVNTDPDAPIFAVADIGAVIDSTAVIEAMEKLAGA